MERVYNKPSLVEYEGVLQKNRNKRPTCDQRFLEWCKENSIRFGSYEDMGKNLGMDSYTEDEKKLMLDKLFEMGFSSAHLANCDSRYLLFNAEDSRELDKIIVDKVPNNLDIIKYKITENSKIKPKRRTQN